MTDPDNSNRMTPEEEARFKQARKGRNLAIGAVLLFFVPKVAFVALLCHTAVSLLLDNTRTAWTNLKPHTAGTAYTSETSLTSAIGASTYYTTSPQAGLQGPPIFFFISLVLLVFVLLFEDHFLEAFQKTK